MNSTESLHQSPPAIRPKRPKVKKELGRGESVAAVRPSQTSQPSQEKKHSGKSFQPEVAKINFGDFGDVFQEKNIEKKRIPLSTIHYFTEDGTHMDGANLRRTLKLILVNIDDAIDEAKAAGLNKLAVDLDGIYCDISMLVPYGGSNFKTMVVVGEYN